jgi:hypothetical protein
MLYNFFRFFSFFRFDFFFYMNIDFFYMDFRFFNRFFYIYLGYFIRNLYKDYNLSSEQWTYSGTSSADGASKTKQKGKELIIKNF